MSLLTLAIAGLLKTNLEVVQKSDRSKNIMKERHKYCIKRVTAL